MIRQWIKDTEAAVDGADPECPFLRSLASGELIVDWDAGPSPTRVGLASVRSAPVTPDSE
jgi:hypothetical protein